VVKKAIFGFFGVIGSIIDVVMTTAWISLAIAYFSGFVQIYRGLFGKIFIVIG
jgi:hypothetical protein